MILKSIERILTLSRNKASFTRTLHTDASSLREQHFYNQTKRVGSDRRFQFQERHQLFIRAQTRRFPSSWRPALIISVFEPL
jgi:hypothetical protein